MEVRGRHIEPQTKSADCPTNKQPPHTRRNLTVDRVDPQRQGTVTGTTANHISSSGPDERPINESGTCDGQNDDSADDNQRSADDQQKCTAETINTETVTDNRQLLIELKLHLFGSVVDLLYNKSTTNRQQIETSAVWDLQCFTDAMDYYTPPVR